MPDEQMNNEAQQTPPEPQPDIKAVDENGVPYFNRFEEAERKRAEAERELNSLREQQLRFMAQPPQPPQQTPFYYATSNTQQPAQEELEDFNTTFQNNPELAVRKMVKSKLVPEMAPDFQKIAEEAARKTFYRESIKQAAMVRFPDLKNPQSDFFKKVAFFMETHPDKYNDPEGILDACSRVTAEMSITQPNPAVQQTNQAIRQRISSASAQVEGASTAPAGEVEELDPKAKELAIKLNIDPKKMAERLKNMIDGKGEYAPSEGKTGKASLR